MRKASKWMRNFLMGRKEEKEKKKDVEENEKFSSGILPPTPTVKRRWSFGRSSRKERGHRNSKSHDSININSVEKLATVSLENQHRNANNLAALVVATSAPVQLQSFLAPKPARYGRNRAVADTAATKIQAAFRSYLARRALCALKALVKLQALVRGHLVRKQTTATIRRMHALMSVQVRARFQRIQMAEKSQSQIVFKSQSSRYRINPLENQFRRPQTQREAFDTNNYETLSKSKYNNLNVSKIGRTEHGVSTRFTGEISFARREHQFEEIGFATAQKTPQRYHGMTNTIQGRASVTYQQPVSHDLTFQPNYMVDTESSKAKSRSQSEPRQRPELSLRSRSKRWDSNNGSQHSSPRLKHAVHDGSQHSSPRLKHTMQCLNPNDGSQRSSPCLNHTIHGNQGPWFMKLYRSKRLFGDSESDANSTNTSHSNYCNSVIAYEPPVNLY